MKNVNSISIQLPSWDMSSVSKGYRWMITRWALSQNGRPLPVSRSCKGSSALQIFIESSTIALWPPPSQLNFVENPKGYLGPTQNNRPLTNLNKALQQSHPMPPRNWSAVYRRVRHIMLWDLGDPFTTSWVPQKAPPRCILFSEAHQSWG